MENNDEIDENKLAPQNPDASQVSDEKTRKDFKLQIGGAGVTLKLGDIIQLYAPQNEDIHEQTYIIDYIDETIVILLDIATLKTHQLTVDENNQITDESIQNIYILSHSEEEGYARQNGLVPKTWVDIYIGGDAPSIITGEITNLEQDMIEVTTFPEMDVIYIDFAYKGLPRDIPIQRFEIRNRPASLSRVESLTDVVSEEEPEKGTDIPLDVSASVDDYPAKTETILRVESAAEVPEKSMYDILNNMYVNADGLVLGEELEEIAQVVEVPEAQRKYGVEIQANDLMDELLSTIPNSQRTKPIMGRIHTLIERFKQMREMFSTFDENGNVSGYIQLGALHKPIVENLQKLDKKISWILPVVRQQKVLYLPGEDNKGGTGGVEATEEEIEAAPDAIFSDLQKELEKQQELFKNYYKNTLPNGINKYENLYTKLDEVHGSFSAAVSENPGDLTDRQEILANLETITDNLDDFYSSTIKHDLSRRRFVIQRYNLGLMKKDKQLMRSGKTVYMRNYMTPSDKITIKSLVTLPEPAVRFSHLDLPSSSILTKVNLHSGAYLNLFQMLRKKTDIATHIVDNLDRELVYAQDEENMRGNKEKNAPEFLENIKEYLLDADTSQSSADKFERFLRVIMPKTRVLFRLIRKYIKDKLSFVEVVKELEPFMIYTSDISYKQHDEIRYFIKQKIADLKQEMVKRAQIFKNIRKMSWRIQPRMHQIKRVLNENRELLHAFETAYGLRVDWSGDNVSQETTALTPMDASELLNMLFSKDGATLFSDIVATMMVKSLSTPENILDAFEPAKLDDIAEMERIKPRDCTRRFLAKQYQTMVDLRKDNNNEDVFCEKELDDTPYGIVDKYKQERKAMDPKDFADFLRLNLIHKHQVSSDDAEDLAKILIEGKRRVRDGEYATLQVTSPDYSYKKYFRRVKNYWAEDPSIDDTTFVDTNTLFCNLSEKCIKNEQNQQCEPAPIAKQRMIEQTKARIKGEFDVRLAGSIEELERKIRAKLEADLRQLSREQMLTQVRLQKYNNLAYDYGSELVENENVVSPHWKLRELVLGQEDFQKRQLNIVEFVEMFCREPMIDELSENAHWLYCLDTNTPLFPQSLFKLAAAFVQGSDYSAKLAEVCKDVGVLSEDGDSVVDKHTGYVLRKIDFITQDEFTEEGIRIVQHTIMEEDLQTKLGKIMEKEAPSKEPAPIFENEQNRVIYNITRTICNNIGVPMELVRDYVLRTTGELMEKMIQNPELYEERAQLMERKKGVRPIPYVIYKDRMMFWIIASCVLVSIQVAIPSIQTKKTFPGCVRSFGGFPLSGGVEDLSGIEYIACVLFKAKSSTEPWNSIEKLDLPTYVSKIREMLEKIMGERTDIGELYLKKQQYLLLNPHETSIPEEHSIERWRSFLPPLVRFTQDPKPQPISKEYEREMMDLIRDGHRKQSDHIGLYHSRAVANSYAIIGAVNAIVRSKEVLLRTSGNIPFLENACCHGDETNPIAYFAKENNNLIQHIGAVKHIEELLRDVRNLGVGSMVYHPGFTGNKYSTIGEIVLVENIYRAFFHYCNFDNDLPIPEPYRAICPEKPTIAQGYRRDWSLLEKVEFLKLQGKQWRPENLEQLMVVVRNQNRVAIPPPATFLQVDAVRDLLESFQQRESEVVEGAFRQRLLAVIDKYNPQKMVEETRQELNRFKNHMAKANEKMYYEIVDFMDRYGNLSNREYDEFQDWLLGFAAEVAPEVVATPTGEIYKKVQNIKNLVYYMSRAIPQMILNKKVYDRIPQHWDLAPIHIRDMERAIEKHWGELHGFFEDEVLYDLLREIMTRLTDLGSLVRVFPTYSPISKGGHTFHALLDEDATNMIYTYFVYSVLYEYIVCSNNPDLLRADFEEVKKQHKQGIRDAADDANMAKAENSQKLTGDQEEVDLDLQELQIRMIGSQEDLKERVARLLRAFMMFEQENHRGMWSYEEIIRRTGLSKKEEKKRITDYLGSLPTEEREIEKQFMKYKMGEWNVGEQRGLFEYDKATYARERAQQEKGVFTVFMQEGGAGGPGAEVEDLDREAAVAAEQEYDAEGMDIGDFGEDYQDGVYYQEDRDPDDYE